jgi:hypothetical protein
MSTAVDPITVVLNDSSWPDDGLFRLGFRVDKAKPISHDMTFAFTTHQSWSIVNEALTFLRAQNSGVLQPTMKAVRG